MIFKLQINTFKTSWDSLPAPTQIISGPAIVTKPLRRLDSATYKQRLDKNTNIFNLKKYMNCNHKCNNIQIIDIIFFNQIFISGIYIISYINDQYIRYNIISYINDQRIILSLEQNRYLDDLSIIFVS